MKRWYTVYRVNIVTGEKTALGSILERRKWDGMQNFLALLAEAGELFGRGTSGTARIVIEPPAIVRRTGDGAAAQRVGTMVFA